MSALHSLRGLERFFLLVALCAAGPALAQAPACTPPETIPTPKAHGPSPGDPARLVPVEAYTLALTWTPQFCRSGMNPSEFQCRSRQRFGFVLHGLWPDAARGPWPQYCKPADPLPPALIRSMLCTTPSADLLQHEWAKHGTCTGLAPRAYFERARGLFETIRYPDMAALSRRPRLAVGDFIRAFADANPAIPADAIRVRITRDRWLDEVWLCLDKRMAFARCTRGQTPGYAWPLRLKIWQK